MEFSCCWPSSRVTCPRFRGPTSRYVLPATSLAYVLVALVGHFRLHEEISPTRWLGIALIAAGVGFVAAGPSVTPRHEFPGRYPRSRSLGDEVMKDLYAWAAIGLIVLASTTGDVLLSYSMKRVGDVGELWKRRGILAVVGRVLTTPTFALGLMAMGIAFYSLLFGLSWGNLSLVVPASASLTFVANAVAARIFLHERVGRRRWIAALLVAGGVVLMAV